MLCFILHARLRVHLASGIPCALFYRAYEKFLHTSGASRGEIAEACLVIASESEAISLRQRHFWIASSQALLAMTVSRLAGNGPCYRFIKLSA
jgi:hypothetical protein